jgi:hypothetical protein
MAELLARLELRSQQGFLIFNASEHPAATTGRCSECNRAMSDIYRSPVALALGKSGEPNWPAPGILPC